MSSSGLQGLYDDSGYGEPKINGNNIKIQWLGHIQG